MMNAILAGAGLVAAASAFTQPVQSPSYGALLTPDLSTPVTTGETFDITWSPSNPTDGVTVSLVLCKGPSTNCVLQDTAIVEGVAASAASYSWSVPCDLSEGTQNTDTGYGMLIIVDGTGQFQYSTQFSVLAGSSCSSISGRTTVVSSSVTYTDAAKTWLGWSSSATANSTAAAATYTAPSSKYSTLSTITSVAATTTGAYSAAATATSTTAAATSASPSPFTGGAAAALPNGFVNVAGLAAAGLAMLAL